MAVVVGKVNTNHRHHWWLCYFYEIIFFKLSPKLLLIASFALSSCIYVALYYVQTDIDEFHFTHHQRYVTKFFDQLLVDATTSPYYYSADKFDQLFKQRFNQTNQVCRKRNLLQDKTRANMKIIRALRWNYSVMKSFYVDDNNKLLMCIIPKVASSALKQMLLYTSVDSPFSTYDAAGDGLVIHNESYWPKNMSFKPLNYYGKDNKAINFRIANYTKIIWVRHPLVRLVSAWNSKLNGNNPIYFNRFGSHILTNYRNISKEAAKNETSVTLEEFFRYIKDAVKPDRMLDVHWSTYNTQCMPCLVNYDYIINLEHWYPETLHVLANTVKYARRSLQYEANALDNIARFLTATRSNGDEKWKEMIRKLPKQLVNSIIKLFQLDFDLFQYNTSELL